MNDVMTRLRTYLLFRRFRRALAPRRGFRRALWRTLEAELRPAPAGFFAVHRFARVAVPASVIILAFGGTSTYAYASSEVTPDHPLYGLRRGVEAVEERAAVTPRLKAAAQARRLEHRLAEAERATAKDGRVEQALVGVEDEFRAGKEPDAATARPVLDAVMKADDAAIGRLEKLAERKPAQALTAVRRVIQDDAERIKRRLTGMKDERAKAFLEGRLARRKEALMRIAGDLREKALESSSTPVRAIRIERTIQKFEGIAPLFDAKIPIGQ